MTRREAWDQLASVGGTPEQSVTRKTTHLVIGPSECQGQVLTGDAMTGKMAKAAALRAKGHPIEIMSEDDFLRSL
jgi:DNA polymerase III subunit epsilon